MQNFTASQLIITRCLNKILFVFAQTLKGLSGKAEYASYHKISLLYLACVDVETGLSSEERLARAHGLGISALLGDTIYNFGELVRYRRASLALTKIEFTSQLAHASHLGLPQQDST